MWQYEESSYLLREENEGGSLMELLFALLAASGPSGNEKEVRSLIMQAIKPYVDQVYVDKFGNLIAHKQGKGPVVMLVAHMDEVGLMIRAIDEKGLISCLDVGDIEPITVLGERVKIKTNAGFIYGIITLKEISSGTALEDVPHLREIRFHDLIIDTGLNKEELLALGVQVGTYLELTQNSCFLGSTDYLAGKALDDRIGCYILIELAKKIKKPAGDLYFVFTVQEEVGLYGAKTSIQHIDPCWALIVDVTNADDFSEKSSKSLGMGPCLTVMDSDMITNHYLNNLLRELAKKHKIPLQFDVTDVGTTDALDISISKGGIPSTVLGIPMRNIHTTVGVINMKDVHSALKLIELFLKDPPAVCYN